MDPETPRSPLEQAVSAAAIDLYILVATEGYVPGEADDEETGHLLNAGLLRETPNGHIPVDPGAVGTRLQADLHSRVADLNAQAAAMLHHAASVPETLGPLLRAYERRAAGGSAGLIEHLQGAEVINARVAQVLDHASQEVLVTQPGLVAPGQARRPQKVEQATDRDMAALRRGVRMRTIYSAETRLQEHMGQIVELKSGAGAEYRILQESFQRMFIIDRRIAVIPANGVLATSSEALAQLVHDPVLAAFLAEQFERDWRRSEPWDLPAPVGISSGERQMLSGLAAGGTQQSISNDMGVSMRMGGKLISKLKARYGVETLFQLGAAWRERGNA
jgi:hypothetical protein